MGQLLIKNARHLIHDNELKMQDVLINDGKIVEIADKVTTPATRTIDAHGALLTPGLVDVHVHFREPGSSSWRFYDCTRNAKSQSGTGNTGGVSANQS